MRVQVRLSGDLASQIGRHRLSLDLADGATVNDLLDHLRQAHPQSAARLEAAVPVIQGQHVSHGQVLHEGQEVALLLPIAGG